jgi:FkbM family methyltransferase
MRGVRELLAGSTVKRYTRPLFRNRRTAQAESKDDRYNRLTVSVLKRVVTADSNCLDIGASRGDLLRHMVAAAPRGQHVAFEPLPHCARELRRNFPAVHVMELALADTTDVRPFRHVVFSDGYSGFWRRPYDDYEDIVRMIRVQVRRLDDVIPESYTPRFIKVDVEGAELLVFRGGLETLRRAQPYVAFEISWQSEEVWDVLVEGAGLGVNCLDRWLAGRRPLTRDEFLQERSQGAYFFLAHPR